MLEGHHFFDCTPSFLCHSLSFFRLLFSLSQVTYLLKGPIKMHNMHNKIDRVMPAIENSCLSIRLPQKNVLSHWVKYLNVFFYKISYIFSRFLIISWYDFIMFDFIIISTMKLVYIQLIYYWIVMVVISIYAVLESQFISNVELFRTKKISGFYPKYYVWCFHERTVENMKVSHNLILTGWHL